MNIYYPMISGMRDLLISALSTTEIKYLSLAEFVIRLVMMEKFGISNCVTKRDFPNCKCSGELSMCKVKGKKETSRYLTLNSIINCLFFRGSGKFYFFFLNKHEMMWSLKIYIKLLFFENDHYILRFYKGNNPFL